MYGPGGSEGAVGGSRSTWCVPLEAFAVFSDLPWISRRRRSYTCGRKSPSQPDLAATWCFWFARDTRWRFTRPLHSHRIAKPHREYQFAPAVTTYQMRYRGAEGIRDYENGMAIGLSEATVEKRILLGPDRMLHLRGMYWRGRESVKEPPWGPSVGLDPIIGNPLRQPIQRQVWVF